MANSIGLLDAVIRKYVVLLVVALITLVLAFALSVFGSAGLAWLVHSDVLVQQRDLTFADALQGTFPVNAVLFPFGYGLGLLAFGAVLRKRRKIWLHFAAVAAALLISLPSLLIVLEVTENLDEVEQLQPAGECLPRAAFR